MTVSILGTEYSIIKKQYEDEPLFKKRGIDGYCDSFEKQIVYCDMTTCPGWEDETQQSVAIAEKETIRHEIVHAFLDESGLSASALRLNDAWSKNEEMVDWFALQGVKIYEAWKEAKAL